MDYSAIKQIFDAVDDKDKVKIGLEAAKWLATQGWKYFTTREKNRAKDIRQSLIQTATMDDIREFSPAYQAVSRHLAKQSAAAGATTTPPAKRVAYKKSAAKKWMAKKAAGKRSAAKKAPAKGLARKTPGKRARH